jgi:glycosyltransferase involved in cell wall biosynthesis
MHPAKVYYFAEKYDLAVETVPPDFQRITFPALIWALTRSSANLLEIWEPLWVRELPRHVVLTLVWKLSRPMRRRHVVSYAMENNDLGALMTGGRPPYPLVLAFSLVLGAYMRLVYSRIAYASAGSRRIYQGLPGVSGIPSKTIENLPARPAVIASAPSTGANVVFLARLEARKGIDVLMAAWERVEQRVPQVRLIVIGDGPLSDTVASWALEDPARRSHLGALPHDEAVARVGGNRVLVLPSIRSGRWREQIGLPIHEGLLAGCMIVTTTETGLAAWLSERGHKVVAPGHSAALADAIVEALEAPLDREDVKASLPLEEGRVAANRWMNARLTASVVREG